MFTIDLPTESLTYLVLYLVTLMLHVVAMNYVVAGALVVAGAALFRLGGDYCDATRSIVAVVKDWLPLALGVTITLGVAPILFIQLLYKHSFYTANLLLFHRWMAILPVLIIAFYLLYLQKTEWLERQGRGLRAAVAVGVLGMFLFTAWSWSENHLLSLAGQEVWTAQYAAGRWWYVSGELAPRLSLWMIGSLATFAVMVAWQLVGVATTEVVRRLALIAICGAGGSVLAAIWYAMVLPPELIETFRLPVNVAIIVPGSAPLVVYAVSWSRMASSGRLARPWLISASTSMAVAISSATLLREIRRLVALEANGQLVTAVRDTRQAAHAEGLGVFLLFLVANAAIIVVILLSVRRALANSRET